MLDNLFLLLSQINKITGVISTKCQSQNLERMGQGDSLSSSLETTSCQSEFK